MKLVVRSLAVCLALSSGALAQPAPSFNKPLVSDISSHEIEIHESFSGTELLLYGARNEQGDLIVVVRGPDADLRLRRKERIAGMWMHVESKRYGPLPLYYAVGSTKPIDTLLSAQTRRLLGIGAENVITSASDGNATFISGTLNEFQRRHWYTETSPIRYFGETLFRTNIPFPDSLPRGDYTVETYLVRDGSIVSSQTVPLTVFKTGLDAWIFDAAHNQPWLYGLSAIFMAITAGWFANRLFSRA